MSRSELKRYYNSLGLKTYPAGQKANDVFRLAQVAPGLERMILQSVPTIRQFNPDCRYRKRPEYTKKASQVFSDVEQGIVSLRSPMTLDYYGYHPEEESYREVTESLGNGFLSVPTYTPGSKKNSHVPGVFVNGFYETRRLEPHEREGENTASPVPKLVKMPGNELFINNGFEILDMDTANLQNYHTSLNMYEGVVTTEFDWIDSYGNKTHVKKIKIVSQTRHHVIAEKTEITPEFRDQEKGKLSVKVVINSEYENVDGRYLKPYKKGSIAELTQQTQDTSGIYLLETGIETGRVVAVGNRLRISQRDIAIHGERSIDMTGENRAAEEVAIEVTSGQTYVAESIMNIYTSREALHPIVSMVDELPSLPSMEVLLKEHTDVLHKKWRVPLIRIGSSDTQLQEAINYNLFHLIQQGQSMDPNISVMARSATEYYNGHVFWDMDICDMPFFIATNPDVARMHLLYRFINKAGAQKKAREYGLDGMFPYWESTLATSDRDATPRFAKNPNGTFGKVHTKEQSYHVASDIAYAVWQYYLATGDKSFLRTYGAELIIETAKFWISKLKKDNNITRSDQINKPLHLRKVLGPDEYQEFDPETKEPGINDNYFTNKMAQMNIRYALALAQVLDLPAARYHGLNEQTQAEWKKFADNIEIPYNKQSKLYLQFDKVHMLHEFPFREFYPGVEEVNMKMIEHGFDPNEYAVIKQADVLLGMFLSREKDKAKWEVNYKKYSRETSHGSSLSRWVHTIAAIKAGEMDEAYEHFQKAVYKAYRKSEGLKRGIPTAALGGVWQAIVYGFGGLDISEQGIMIDPHLPVRKNGDGSDELLWDELEYGFIYQSSEVRVRITSDRIYYSSDRNIPIRSSLPLIRVLQGTDRAASHEQNNGNGHRVQSEKERLVHV